MMHPLKPIALLGMAALLGHGCNMNCLQGTGTVAERTVQVGAFEAIEVDGAMEVAIERGPEQAVTVIAQPNLIPLLDTVAKGGTWRINTSQCWHSSGPFKVHIITPAPLTSIKVGGSGDVACADVFSSEGVKLSVAGSGSIIIDGINTKVLDGAISGSGSITLRSGTCAKLGARISGSGELHARELAANEADVKISGSGDASITAISKLAAKVSGSGQVRYAGKPDVDSKVSGSGSVTPLQ